MTTATTLLLDPALIEQKIRRMAFEVYEYHDYAGYSELLIAGIHGRGAQLARRVQAVLAEISPLQTELIDIHLSKDTPAQAEIRLEPQVELAGRSVLLVDDVLNSGRTLAYSLKPFLLAPIQSIQTLVLVERTHRRFPIRADYVGYALSTTVKEHVRVELGKKEGVYLE